ncbi:bifunctional precorrin-2 dehydrogenase/sirohydrochlorin ferrochelatase [Meiothermus sp. CFH 77666]|uniref:precorrin-2 dehydrogenase/sirohydrochlorin ferrochelatase family protein n=1 Tax=Meiothermus sp. CFH 77666 TaxID=2817942 RepID=UPI001AA01AB8|nr:bifunctional precorrin-2 dehydrogenase/sirohydrochlorin ferrochelatase [Meiothermus sp. CFH 77666]MBO1436868.1 bifunctional precorrin-2 dehydrogenase/sirohydrochlorin ferrochelatase [Meiothermus sp. CFH 77666]
MLDLRGKRVVFIGGGFETETKVRALLAAEAQVTLISPENHPDLYPLPAGLIHLRRGYQPGDLEGFMLAISHPVNRSLNAQVATEARQQGVWLNAVDDPAYCDFILPAVHRQGDLIIAVSTSGSAPALGVRIKARLAKEYGPEYAEYLRILREFRPVVAAAYPEHFEARKAAWYRLVDADALSLIRLGRLEQARELLRRALEEAEPQLEVV